MDMIEIYRERIEERLEEKRKGNKIQAGVMRRAWEIKEEKNVDFSSALKEAWKETKDFLFKNAKKIAGLKSGIDKMLVYVLQSFEQGKIYKNGISVIKENVSELKNFYENTYIKEIQKKMYFVQKHLEKRDFGYEIKTIKNKLDNFETTTREIKEYDVYSLENDILELESNTIALDSEIKEYKERLKKIRK